MSITHENTAFKVKVDNCTPAELANKVPEVAALVYSEGKLKVGTGSAFQDVADADPTPDLQNIVIVNQANHATTLGGVIDSTKEYFLDGVIDMGATPITVPVNGLTLRGYSFDISGLTSSENNYTMFVSETPEIGSGDLLGFDYYITVTGSGSKVYELYDFDGNSAIEFVRVNYNNCTSLGDMHSYRQGLESGTGRFGGSPSLTLHGTWLGGYRIATSIVRGMSNSTTAPLFGAGTAFQMNSRFTADTNCDLGTLQPLLDFQSSNFPNPSTLQLNSCEITRNGVHNAEDANITPNISSASLASYWKTNNGIRSTFVGGVSSIAASAETTINTVGDFELPAATTFVGTGLEHFEIDAAGKLKHKGQNPREFEFSDNLILNTGNNKVVSVKYFKYDASEATEIALEYTLQQRPAINAIGGNNLAFFNVLLGVTLDENDELYYKIANDTDETNITVEALSFFRIQER